ncbi:MAG TPA: hypothetical protein VFA56_12385 [Gaiellaceae bacterium]|nr:hypothetical protein [Gaiellaceae bacterium]
MILSDWLVNHEDVAFHAALTVVMPALAAATWGSRPPHRPPARESA